MPDRAIEVNELIELAQRGAKIRIEDRPVIIAQHDPSMDAPTTIVQFDQLIENIGAMTKAH